jgi:drug/metabolite transporter (DMT)-like permease
VIAVAGGLVAAVAWGIAALATARTSRAIGAASTLAWVAMVGLVVTAPAVALTGVPPGLDAAAVGWLTITGVGNISGLLSVYSALRIGSVGIVAPIASTEGAIAAVLAVVAGERIGVASGAMLATIAMGVALASRPKMDQTAHERRQSSRAAMLAMLGALFFGVGLYGAGRLSGDLPVAWILLPARLLGTVAIAVPLLAGRRLRLTRATAPLVVGAGLAEVVGFTGFTIGARHGIAVAAVLASQFAAVAAAAGYVLFHERMSRLQLVGVVVMLVGVAALAALQA